MGGIILKKEKTQAEKDQDKALIIQVGNRIRELRQAQCITSEKLAEAGGISIQYLNELERGKKCMSFLILNRVARCLGVSNDCLIRGETTVSPLCDAAAQRFSELAPIEREMVARTLLQSSQLVTSLGREDGEF